MGLFSSRPETPTMPPFVEHHSSPIMSHQQPYPDMNVIFRSIPKMMQVADDMHRMTNYLEDMRNMCFALSAISALGMLAFLLLKCVKKQKHRRRRFINHIDSEQSSISRNGIGAGMGGGGAGYRHFARHVPNNGDWSHKIVDMENGGGGGGGLGPSGQTTSTNTATTGTVHGGHSRHTPPIHNRYGVAHNAAVHSQNPVHMNHHVAPQDLQSSSLHSAISGNFINGGGNNGGGGPMALGMKVGGGSAVGANKTPTTAIKSE